MEDAHDLGVTSCQVSSTGELATGGTDNLVKVWKVVDTPRDQRSIQLKRTFSDHDMAVMCVRFSPDGKYLASSGGDKYLCLYSMVIKRIKRMQIYFSNVLS